MKTANIFQSIIVVTILTLTLLVGCSNAVEKTDAKPTYRVSFKTTGLLGTGLAIAINSDNKFKVDIEGTHTFPTEFERGNFFKLGIQQQPSNPNQICTFSKLSGEITDNIELLLTCVTEKYSIKGMLDIEPNLFDQLAITVNGNPTGIIVDSPGQFHFLDSFDDGMELVISFSKMPNLQTCFINGSTTLTTKITGSDITDISIKCAYTSPLIAVKPMKFEVQKNVTFTVPSIYNYITDIEVGGNPRILQWNTNTVAQFGEVINNGDGTFDYIPNNNIKSGQDSFSFIVANTKGTQAEGLITLDIAKSWGSRNDFVISPQAAKIRTLLTMGNINMIEYSAGGSNTTKILDKQNFKWVTINPPNTVSRGLINKNKQTISYYTISNAGRLNSKLSIHEFTPSTGQLVQTNSFILPSPDYISAYATSDDQGNIFVNLARKYKDNLGNFIAERWGKFYDAASKSWKPVVKVIGKELDHIASSGYWVNGKPVIFAVLSTGIPVVIEYHSPSNLWTANPISNEIDISSAPPISAQNSAGDIALLWHQKITDLTQTPAVTNEYLKLLIYPANSDIGVQEKTIPIKPSSLDYHDISLTTLANTDFLFMWRIYPSGGTADIYAQTYNTLDYTFNLSTTELALNLNYIRRFPLTAPIVDTLGNALFPYYIRGTGYNLFFRALPYRGSWSTAQQINNAPSSNRYYHTSFDNQGNYYFLFNQANSKNGVYSARRFDMNTTTISPIISADDDNAVKGNHGIVKSNTNKHFFYWSKQNLSFQYDFCLREIIEAKDFDENSLDNEECLNFSYADNQDSIVKLIEDNNQNLLLILGKKDLYFAKKIINTWGKPKTLFTSPILGIEEKFSYDSITIDYLQSDDIISLTAHQNHEYIDATNAKFAEHRIFNYLYF